MTAFKRVCAPVLLACLTATISAGEWTGFRGGDGTGVSKEKGLPTAWGKDSGLAYKVALPGRGLSNPVIAGGRVYVTASSGYRESKLHVLCFDEATGKKLWERRISATGSTACHPVSNMAAPTPVTDGKSVYALFATGDLVAYDSDGGLLWYRSLVGDYPTITNQVGMASSPILVAGVLFVPMDNAGESFAAGIDPKTGKNLWKVSRGRAINWVTPVVLGEGNAATVVYSGATAAEGLDPKTGKKKWEYKGEGLSPIPSPSISDGVVILGGGRAFRPSEEGSKPEEVWSRGPFVGGYASPVVHAGKVYGVTGANAGCYDAKDGKELWKLRVAGPFDGSPVIADGKLFAVNNKGKGYVIDVTGDKGKIAATNDLEDTIQCTPAIANGKIFLRSDKWLYCIGKK